MAELYQEDQDLVHTFDDIVSDVDLNPGSSADPSRNSAEVDILQRITSIRNALSLQQRRVVALERNYAKRPEWQYWDIYAEEYKGIDDLLEEMSFLNEWLFDELQDALKNLIKLRAKANGHNQLTSDCFGIQQSFLTPPRKPPVERDTQFTFA